MSQATILTLANGRGIDLRNPRPEDIDFEALAEHAAKEARFNGATPGVFYSSAEHMARGADAVMAETGDATLAAYFLCHDLHEGLWRDDTTPKKNTIREECELRFGDLAGPVGIVIRNCEYRLENAIHTAAGLPWAPEVYTQNVVKMFDRRMLVTEWAELMADAELADAQAYADAKPIVMELRAWDWKTAKVAWMRRAKMLLPVYQRGSAS